MAIPLQIKRNSTAGVTPTSLADGELAINTADGKLFWKDSAGTIQSMSLSGGGGGGGGLTNWTESVATASPNNTVNSVQLLATAATTNAAAVLAPKGTGAIQAQTASSTSTGGNVRGAYATDWQRSRTAATQVASGQYSTILGGQYNTASSTACTAGGYNCKASSNYAFAHGSSCTASGTSAVALGSSNTASGSSAVSLGSSNTASGASAVSLGNLNASGGFYSVAIGTFNSVSASLFGTAIGDNNLVNTAGQCIGSNNSTGSAYQTLLGNYVNSPPFQGLVAFGASYDMAGFSPRSDDRRYSGLLHLGRTTTDSTTAVTLTSDNSGATAQNQFAIPDNCLAMFRMRVIARRKSQGPPYNYDHKWWNTTTEGVVQRSSGAGTITDHQPIVLSSTPQSSWSPFPDGTVTVAVNATTGCVEVSVVGVGSQVGWQQEVQWLAEIHFVFLGMTW